MNILNSDYNPLKISYLKFCSSHENKHQCMYFGPKENQTVSCRWLTLVSMCYSHEYSVQIAHEWHAKNTFTSFRFSPFWCNTHPTSTSKYLHPQLMLLPHTHTHQHHHNHQLQSSFSSSTLI